MKKIIFLSIIPVLAFSLTSFKQYQTSSVNEFAKMLQGNWEMTSRISHGKPADTEGAIYFNLSKKDNGFTGEQLATESGILDAFVSGGGDNKPYEIASIFTVSLSQGDKNAILFTASGEIVGSYAPFTKGVPMVQTYSFEKKGESFILKTQKLTDAAGRALEKKVQEESQVYDKIVLTKDKIIFSSSTLKLTDTYRRISTKGGKVGGLWNLRKAYDLFKGKLTGNVGQ